MNSYLSFFFRGFQRSGRFLPILVVILVFSISFKATGQLSGNFTVGSGGDYTTLNDVVNALESQGVNGAVTFDIINGTYNEQISIENIPGVSSTNTVTFQSQSNNPEDVQIIFSATGAADNYVVDLSGAQYVTFQNLTLLGAGSSFCRVFSLSSPTSNIKILDNVIAGSTNNSSSDNFAIIYSNNTVVNNVQISGNSISDGSHAIHMTGSSNNYFTGLEISGNTTLSAYMGIRLNYTNNAKIIQNEISLYGGGNYALYLNNCNEGLEIKKNKISLSNAHGIYMGSCVGGNPPLGTRGLIANNFISTGGGNYGLYLGSISNQDFYYNTVNIVGASSSRSLYIDGNGSGNNFVNNNFVNLGTGYAYYVGAPSSISTSDHNNIFSLGNYTGYWNGNRVDLAALQSASSKEENSISVYPHFTSNSDLHSKAPWLDGKGTPVTRVTDDIDGEARDNDNPDIGADEFTPEASSTTPMAGEYTIGSGGDYTDIVSATNDLLLKGMSASVTFNILSGTYIERVSLLQIAGQSNNDSIKFQSQSGNAEDVIWYYAAEGAGDNYTLRLRKVKNVVVQNLTIGSNNANNTTYGRVIYLHASINNVSIINNILAGSPPGGSSNNLATIGSEESFINNLKIINNTFSGGAYSVQLPGLSNNYSSGIEVINNRISGGYMGINITNSNSTKINENVLELSGSANYGMYLTSCNEGLEIKKNKISLSNAHGIYMGSCVGGNPPLGTRGLIANNFISTGGGNRGLYLSTISNQDFYYNTVNHTGNSSSRSMSIEGNGSSNNFVNNIFVNKGEGYAYYAGLTSSIATSNYNNIYSTGTNAAFWGSDREDLSALQFASGKDANSLSVDPLFPSNSNLHVKAQELDGAGTPLAEIIDDIDGDLRDETTPDIGADEFTYGLNYSPSITSVPDTIAYVDSVFTYQVIAEDIDGDSLTYSLTTAPDWLNINSSTGLIEGTPSTDDIGTASVIVLVNDGNGGTDNQTFTITIDQLTGIEALAGQIPDEYNLFQNYPNPFNPITKIRFALPEHSNIIINIYNITGEKILTLLNEERAAGYYEVNFDASSLASGIYFYRVHAGSFSQVKKMILLK